LAYNGIIAINYRTVYPNGDLCWELKEEREIGVLGQYIIRIFNKSGYGLFQIIKIPIWIMSYEE